MSQSWKMLQGGQNHSQETGDVDCPSAPSQGPAVTRLYPSGRCQGGGTTQPPSGTPQNTPHQGKDQHQPPRAETPSPEQQRFQKPFWAQGITGRDRATLA